MKHKVCFLFLVLTICTKSFAQLKDTVFIGTASLKGGETLTYELHILPRNGKIQGYSVMDLNGTDETKADIAGTINETSTQIFFKETKVLSSKTKDTDVQICFLQGALKVKKINGIQVLKGHFEGYLNNGETLCGSGKLILISPKDILKILGKPNLSDTLEEIEVSPKSTSEKLTQTSKKLEKEHQTEQIQAMQPPIDTSVKPFLKKENSTIFIVDNSSNQTNISKHVLSVKPGKTIELLVSSPDLTLDVWDDKNIDGDEITLMQGNKALIKNYTLDNKRLEMPIKMGAKLIDTLTLIAISEGTDPLNTSRIKITSASDAYTVDATTTIDKEVLIVLRRKK